MGTRRRGDCPCEAPAVGVEHRKRPQVDRVARKRPAGQLQQAHEVSSAVTRHHAFGIAGRARRVVQRDRFPFVGRPDSLERRVPAGQQRLVVHHADRSRAGSNRVVDVDQQRGMLQALDGTSCERRKLAVHEHDLGFAVAQDEGDALGVEPTVDCIQHRTRKRHAKVCLQHRRGIGRNDRHGIPTLYATRDQRRSQPQASVSRLRPRLAELAMDKRNAIGVDISTSIEESEGTERYMVRGCAIESARVGCLAHRWYLRCAGRVRRVVGRVTVSNGAGPECP